MDLKSMTIEELKELQKKYETISVQENLSQLTMKTLINAVYGAMGNKHFPLYNPDIADCITSIGRYNIITIGDYVIDKINDRFKKDVCYRALTDTDSFFLEFTKMLEILDVDEENIVDVLDGFAKTVISKLIKEKADETFRLHNNFKMTYEMDREKIGKVIITGKKRYAVELFDDEGTRLAEPEYKITGLEIKRSSTPALIREELLRFVKMMFKTDNQNLLKELNQFRKKYMKKEFSLDQISIPMGVNNLEKFESDSSHMPIHVRGSIAFNTYIEKKRMTDYQRISSGDKIKFTYLKTPNPLGQNVVSFNDQRFMFDSGLEKYVDYKTMFEKTFISPLETLVDAIGWNMNPTSVAMKGLF